MASIADINIRIGAQITGLIKGLNTAERRLNRSATRFSRIGNELSLSVSLPLIAIGRQAISAASDFDRLEKALNTITGSAAETSRLFKELEKDAKAPGVEIEGLVKGIVRLANTGQTIEQARREMNAFGNAIALAGGTAADLDGVSLALTQIISKGKISAEEINQLGERVPQIRKAIQDAFGTADSEALQKAGVGVEDFVDKVTAELEKLPQAQSGLANALNNTGQVIRRSFAQLGKEIDQTFNLTGNLEKFADAVSSLTNRFSSLDSGTKKFILTTAALTAGIGPAFKVFSLFKTAQLAMISSFKSLVVGIKNFAGGVLLLTQRFIALNTISKLTIAGLAATAIAGAVIAWNKYRASVADVTATKRVLSEVQSTALQSIAEEKVALDRLIGTIKDENTTKRDRAKAIGELQRISPEYFGGLSREKALISEVTAASDAYIEALTRRAKATAAQQKLVEIEKELLDVAQQIEKAEPTFFQTAVNVVTAFGNSSKFATSQINDLVGNLETNKSALEAQKAALVDVIKETDAFTASTNRAATAASRPITAPGGGRQNVNIEEIQSGSERFSFDPGIIEDVGRLAEKYSEARQNIEGVNFELSGQDAIFQNLASQFELAGIKAEIFGTQQNLLRDKLSLTRDALNAAIEQGFSPTSTVVQTLVEQMKTFNEELQGISEGPLVGINNIIKAATANVQRMASSGETSFKKLGKAALSGAADVARAKLIEATTSYVADAFVKFGVFGALVAGAAGAVVGGLFNRVISGLKLPALAEGGLAFGPTFALVGDNPNARADPEVIAPLSKLKSIIDGSGSGELVGQVTILGDEMNLLIKRAVRDQLRG